MQKPGSAQLVRGAGWHRGDGAKPWALASSARCTEAPRSPLADTVKRDLVSAQAIFPPSVFCLFVAF